jgi:putative transcriptional regulator
LNGVALEIEGLLRGRGGHRIETRPPAPIHVRALRERLRLTQRQFAGWFGFPVATLRHWERGNRKPAGTALVLLHMIRDNPRAVL